jgi:hypothetical protein
MHGELDAFCSNTFTFMSFCSKYSFWNLLNHYFVRTLKRRSGEMYSQPISYKYVKRNVFSREQLHFASPPETPNNPTSRYSRRDSKSTTLTMEDTENKYVRKIRNAYIRFPVPRDSCDVELRVSTFVFWFLGYLISRPVDPPVNKICM